MPKEIIQFLSYKETVQNRSPLTVAEYANDLRTFFRYMKAKRNNLRAEDIDGLSIDDIDKAFIVSVTEADIYEFLTNTYRVEPSRTLFIDDTPANIEGAMYVGWQGFCFNRPGKLAAFVGD